MRAPPGPSQRARGVCGREAAAIDLPVDCGALNRKIVYIPIGQLSPTKLKRIRVVHVLDDYSRRDVAKDYIW